MPDQAICGFCDRPLGGYRNSKATLLDENDKPKAVFYLCPTCFNQEVIGGKNPKLVEGDLTQ